MGLHTGSVGLLVESSENPTYRYRRLEDVVEVPFYVDEVASNEGIVSSRLG